MWVVKNFINNDKDIVFMKSRLYLLVFVFLVCLSFVSADDNSTNTTETDDSDYSISFELDKNRVQLGDNILLKGTVYRDNKVMNEQVNMIFFFSSEADENEIYLSVYDGTFSLTPRLRDLSTGTYQISLELIDLNGNRLEYFKNLQSLTIDNQLLMDLKIEKENLLPGGKLQILGSVTRNLDKKDIPSGIVTVSIDGEEHTTEILNGDLDYELILNRDITSGDHDVKVIVEDSSGNIGQTVLSLNIIPQQISLKVELEKKGYLHGEEINILASLYDQANNEMGDDVTIKIYNQKGKKIFQEEFMSGDRVVYQLPEYAGPGEWKISVKSSKIETDKFIEVTSTKSVDIELVYQQLKIKNTGNINYEDPLEIIATAENHEKEIEVRTNLAPGEEILVDLFKHLKDLKYTVNVLNTEQSFEVEINDERNVGDKAGDFFKSISGQAVRVSGSKNSNVASYTFGLIIALFIAFVAFYNKRGTGMFKIPSGIVKRRKRSKGGKFQGRVNVPEERKMKVFGKSKEKEEIEDFKTRILKDIEKSSIREKEEKPDNGPYNVQPFFPVPKDEPKKQQEKPKRFSFDKPLTKK
jgi:hypothetical protein